MNSRFLQLTILLISILLVACSNSGSAQETKKVDVGGRYIVKEETPAFSKKVYLELKPTDNAHGTYRMNPPSVGTEYEIKDDKIILYDNLRKPLYTGSIKDGDVYLPLRWSDQQLGTFRFRKTDGIEESNQRAVAPTPPPPPSLDDQAADEIRNIYGSIYAKCGDSYYRIETGMPPTYRQFKEVTFQAAPRALSEADRLNGVEWAGKVNVSSRFVRSTFAQAGRQRWGDYGVPAEVAHFSARKVKGNWQLDNMFPSLRRMYQKPTCAEIPKD
jgi:hypothetical protein